MSIWQWILMILGWWGVAFAVSHRVSIKVGDRCPCPKCWIAAILAALYGAGYYSILGFKGGFFSTPEYVLSFIPVAALAAAIALALCPIKMMKE